MSIESPSEIRLSLREAKQAYKQLKALKKTLSNSQYKSNSYNRFDYFLDSFSYKWLHKINDCGFLLSNDGVNQDNSLSHLKSYASDETSHYTPSVARSQLKNQYPSVGDYLLTNKDRKLEINQNLKDMTRTGPSIKHGSTNQKVEKALDSIGTHKKKRSKPHEEVYRRNASPSVCTIKYSSIHDGHYTSLAKERISVFFYGPKNINRSIFSQKVPYNFEHTNTNGALSSFTAFQQKEHGRHVKKKPLIFSSSNLTDTDYRAMREALKKTGLNKGYQMKKHERDSFGISSSSLEKDTGLSSALQRIAISRDGDGEPGEFDVISDEVKSHRKGLSFLGRGNAYVPELDPNTKSSAAMSYYLSDSLESEETSPNNNLDIDETNDTETLNTSQTVHHYPGLIAKNRITRLQSDLIEGFLKRQDSVTTTEFENSIHTTESLLSPDDVLFSADSRPGESIDNKCKYGHVAESSSSGLYDGKSIHLSPYITDTKRHRQRNKKHHLNYRVTSVTYPNSLYCESNEEGLHKSESSGLGSSVILSPFQGLSSEIYQSKLVLKDPIYSVTSAEVSLPNPSPFTFKDEEFQSNTDRDIISDKNKQDYRFINSQNFGQIHKRSNAEFSSSGGVYDQIQYWDDLPSSSLLFLDPYMSTFNLESSLSNDYADQQHILKSQSLGSFRDSYSEPVDTRTTDGKFASQLQNSSSSDCHIRREKNSEVCNFIPQNSLHTFSLTSAGPSVSNIQFGPSSSTYNSHGEDGHVDNSPNLYSTSKHWLPRCYQLGFDVDDSANATPMNYFVSQQSSPFRYSGSLSSGSCYPLINSMIENKKHETLNTSPLTQEIEMGYAERSDVIFCEEDVNDKEMTDVSSMNVEHM